MNRPNPHDSLGRWVSAYRLLAGTRDQIGATEWLSNAESLRLLEVHRDRTLEEKPADGPSLTQPAHLDQIEAEDAKSDEELALAEALEKLERLRPRAARVIRLRAFEGYSNLEVAAELRTTIRTVEREWQFAGAWLARELSSDD